MKYLITILLLISQIAGANMIKNGDFISLNLNNWSTFGTVVATAGYAQFGSGGNNRGAIYQQVRVEPDTWYRIKFDTRHAGNDFYGPVILRVYNGTNWFWTPTIVQYSEVIAVHNWGVDGTPDQQNLVTYFNSGTNDIVTVSFTDRATYTGASHDPGIDNIEMYRVGGFSAHTQIRQLSTLSQDTFWSVALFPPELAIDNQVSNGNGFMHTLDSGSRVFDLTFHEVADISEIVLWARPGFLGRAGTNLRIYDDSNVLLDTKSIGNASASYTWTDGWQNVKRLNIDEDDAVPLNFSRLDVTGNMSGGTVIGRGNDVIGSRNLLNER